MAARTERGICRLCRQDAKLIFDHIPPKSAFNNQPLKGIKDAENWFNIDINDVVKEGGKIETHQRGMGAYTLCESCNNGVLGHYQRSYPKFVRSLDVMSYGQPSLSRMPITLNIQPLNVFKTIIGMMISFVGQGYLDSTPSIRRFLLDKERKDFDQNKLMVSMALFSNTSVIRKWSGLYGTGNSEMFFGNGKVRMFAEIAFRPAVFVFSLDGKVPDERFLSINHFAQSDLNQWHDITLNLTRLSPGNVPGTYTPLT